MKNLFLYLILYIEYTKQVINYTNTLIIKILFTDIKMKIKDTFNGNRRLFGAV